MDKHPMMRPRSNRPRVYIIDDSLIFRAMLETMVGEEPAFEICGVASSCDEARKDIKWVLPDIVLLDLNMPGTPGLVFLEELADYWHAMNIVVISGEARLGNLRARLQSGRCSLLRQMRGDPVGPRPYRSHA